MKIVGTVLLGLGILGTLYFGYEAYQDSNTFSVFGADIAVSNANWTPVIVSGVFLLLGFFLRRKG